MTDPLDQQLRDAMNSGAAKFSPAGAMGVTRRHLLRRVHRRQRQVSLAVVALLLVGAGTVVAATNRSADSARRVAAAGGPASSATTIGRPDGGGPGAGQAGVEPGVSPGGQPATGTGTLHSGAPPTSTGGTGGSQTTTVPVAATTPTTAPSVTPSTGIGTAPTTTVAPAVSSRVQGTVLFSPVCPVERVPPDPACAPRPGAAHIQLVRGDGTVAAQGNAGSTGHFSIAVPPGTYTVVATALNATSAIGRGCSATPADVVVEAGTTSNVAVSCDTGIR